MEESILLARDEAWTVLRVIERVVDAGERSGNVDPDVGVQVIHRVSGVAFT